MTAKPEENEESPAVVVVNESGAAVEAPAEKQSAGKETAKSLAGLVEQPAKVMRVGNMIKQLLEEVKAAPLDEASRVRLREIHRSSLDELEDGLAPELIDELERLTLPLSSAEVPSEAELRIAQAQLVGWLEGLFHGIQTTLFAQQMAAQAQLQQMRALPPGVQPPPGHPAAAAAAAQDQADAEDNTQSGRGMYL